jgi:hypothetical protein
VFGDLKILPSDNFGDFGQQLGEAVTFNWKWYYTAPRFVIWLVLIAALALPKSNRNINALAIFFPIAVLSLFWSIFLKVFQTTSSNAIQFSTMFQSMSLAIAVLWLLSDYIGKFRVFIRFLLSATTIVLVAGLGTLSYSTSFSIELILFLGVFIFMTLAILASIVLSRKLCRKRYCPVRFMLWLALWMLLFVTFALIGYFIVGSIILSTKLSNILSELLEVTAAGLVFALFMYIMNLPFMIMGFVNPLFRERFLTCLRLKPAAIITDSNQETVISNQAKEGVQKSENGIFQ